MDDLERRSRRHREQFSGTAIVVAAAALTLALLVASIVVSLEVAQTKAIPFLVGPDLWSAGLAVAIAMMLTVTGSVAFVLLREAPRQRE